ncbi:glutathione S-transferase [Rhodobacteraceae bacterium NNCM2]|nr:glutathione S-transferase [Coraliihabitans acroporae]
MSLPTPVRLFDQPRAPNPMRLNLFLAEKGVDIPRENINLMENEHKTPEYLAKVGAPVCPALELSDGTVLTETQAIARYIEALHPEPNMLGHDPFEMAVIEMWQRRVEFGLFAAVGSCFRHTNRHLAVLEDQVPEWGEINRGRINGHLEMLDKRLEGREWLAADRMTNADITAYLATGFTRIIKHEIPEGLENLAAWRARIDARPSAAAIRS